MAVYTTRFVASEYFGIFGKVGLGPQTITSLVNIINSNLNVKFIYVELFRLPVQISFWAYPDCRWTAKDHMKCDFSQLDPNHVWRWFKMWFQSDFYRCVLFQTLWPLKLQIVFCVPRNATHSNVKSRVIKVLSRIHRRQHGGEQLSRDWCLLVCDCLEGKMMVKKI